MKKKIAVLITMLIMALTLCTGCWSSMERELKDFGSDINGGLNRVVTIYNANGDVMKTYKGKIDFEQTEGGYVKFDFNGKRYLYYNCYVEAIEVDE